MLASLEREGKTPGHGSTPKTRSRTRIGLVALAVVAIGGAGAFFALAPTDDAMGSVQVAAAPHRAVAVPVAASQPAVAAALSSGDAASVATTAASTPAAIELAAVPAAAPSAPLGAGSTPTPAEPPVAVAHAGGNPLDKLALNDAPAEPAKNRHGHDRSASVAASHDETVASAKKATQHAAAATASRKAKREDDADTELVAAIIARLDRRGAQPAGGASGVVAAAPVNVSDAVRRCSQNSDLVEARQCRSRACESHWGKVDACPASRAPKTSQADGDADAKRG